ncbi:MAG: ECF-type sigma factor, partial [Bacteroidota bacterium]
VSAEITALLNRYETGDEEALHELLPLVYNELQSIADAYIAKERADLTMNTRELVHEAYERLLGSGELKQTWESRRHFYVVVARVMRRVLCDYARKQRAVKRGRGEAVVTVTTLSDLAAQTGIESNTHLMLSVDKALQTLEKKDPDLVRLVELRFYSGMTLEETAKALNTSRRSLTRDWQIARRVLYRALKEMRE